MANFKIEVLDVEKFVKVNNLKEITSSIAFIRDGIPNPEGLLSNEIFGISKDDRVGIFAYIDLGDYFLHPLVYKKWRLADGRIDSIINGTKKFSLDTKGYLVEDENGKTGMKFLKDNIDKINIARSNSRKRDVVIDFIMKNKKTIFMKKMIMIPAFYRDVNNSGTGKPSLGDINKYYNKLLMSVKALKESAEYGLSMSDLTKFRIQNTIVEIYNWLTDEPQLAKKNGIVRRSVMSKTTDYGSRLVLSAPNLVEEHYTDIVCDTDNAIIPLASLCANLYPYMIFWLRRYFENALSDSAGITIYDEIPSGKLKVSVEEVDEPRVQFSDDRLKKELKRFINGFSNRLLPVEVKLKDNKTTFMGFSASYTKPEGISSITTPDEEEAQAYETDEGDNIINRRLTWCDLFFQAAVECSKDKHVVLTRYPMDTMHNLFPNKINVGSMKETEALYLGSDFYPHYPKIREEMIESNTSNLFVDTLRVSNTMLKAIGGDYDGDQMSCRVVFSTEGNADISEYLDSKLFLVDFGGGLLRTSSNEAVQSFYNLTLILPGTKIQEPKF